MEANATAKYVRISARKVRAVIEVVRGKDVDEALAILRFTPRGGRGARCQDDPVGGGQRGRPGDGW